MEEFYLVSLNHNDNLDKSKLKNILYKGIYYDMPFAFEESKAYELYEDVEVIAYKSTFGLKDVLTSEVIVKSVDGNIDALSYSECKKATGDDIIRITNQYKKMTEEDKLRYKNRLISIKNKSIALYNEKEELRKKIIIDEMYAREYLNTLLNTENLN